ncbi:hypothetical protein O6H91_Y273700 [Diphasiastrum complanatum]|nr:hypothetical protein O6H91_Y273700 [Diphasiastrum complanatum]
MPQMDAASKHEHKMVMTNHIDWEESYRPLPFVFFGLLMVWTVLLGFWILNTWCKRQWQTGNLQWALTLVPILKALVLGLSFAFWYSCLNLSMCSFWVAFGVFVSRIFFETSCFIGFLLISYGYCIMHEQLSLSERRSIAGLSSLLYLTLTGYKAAVPQFAVLVVVMYSVLLYVIFLHVSRNLNLLQEQLQYIHDEGVHMMHTAIYTKYTMFKNFQGVMLIMMVAEILMHARPDGVASEYWMRLLLREWTEIAMFFYIGWTFRSREVTPFFTVIPRLHSSAQRTLPPIYSVEMDEKDFNNLNFKEWNIGVPTSIPGDGGIQKTVLVIVQNPGTISSQEFSEESAMEPTTRHPAAHDQRRSSKPPCSLRRTTSVQTSLSLDPHDKLKDSHHAQKPIDRCISASSSSPKWMRCCILESDEVSSTGSDHQAFEELSDSSEVESSLISKKHVVVNVIGVRNHPP